ncbi:MAG TPA: outer membrane protein assembly factor BamC, partial [Gallionella sp.]|nr:outer membrane protein assembly factor BamC [Gallionella sp.]
MKVLQIVISGAALVALASCSTLGADGKRIDYGAAAVQVPSLEVPPDLTTPSGDDRYKVPQGEGETVTTYSDFSKGGAGRPASLVLPEVQGVHMERNNTQRWLVINDKAENVWPVIKAFWQELGLTISSEDQASGVMETAWAENRARITPGASANDQEFSKAFTAGERDQYLTRLERGKDGVSTEVYITHRGIREEFSEARHTSRWVARAYDPELEAIILQRLMVRFGVDKTKAAGAVAAVGTTAAASAVPAVGPAMLNAPEPAGMASLREVSAGNTIVVVNDAFDRSWRKVGLALESAGLAVEDKDRDKGIYYLRPVRLESSLLDKLKFWKGNEDTTRR